MTVAVAGSEPTTMFTQHEAYESAYACQDDWLTIACQHGQDLEIVRANYGRFSIAVCNVEGRTDFSVNCQSPSSSILRTLKERY